MVDCRQTRPAYKIYSAGGHAVDWRAKRNIARIQGSRQAENTSRYEILIWIYGKYAQLLDVYHFNLIRVRMFRRAFFRFSPTRFPRDLVSGGRSCGSGIGPAVAPLFPGYSAREFFEP
jgi:hypothetical protein